MISNNYTEEMIPYLEELSKIRLTCSEKEKFKTDLKKIIEYIGIIKTAPLSEENGSSQPFEFSSHLREDIVCTSSYRNDILKNSPQSKNGCFAVPKTVEREEK